MAVVRWAMARSGVRAAGALLAAWVLATAPAAATPLRVSVQGLDDPGPATTVPGSTAPARFVAATDAPPAPPAPPTAERRSAEGEDGETALTPTHELPQGVAGPDLNLPHPDETDGVARLLEGAGAVPVVPPVAERRLGEFAPPPPAARADAIDGPPADAEPLPDLPVVDVDALRQQRLLVMMVVVPLVLAATAAWWWVDRGRRHPRRTHRRPRRSSRQGVREHHG